MSRVMLVHDDAIMTTQLQKTLTFLGHEVCGVASSAEGGVKMARDLGPDVVLMDIIMPGALDGISASEVIKKELDIPIIFLTVHANGKLIQQAKKVGASVPLVNPLREREIVAAIEMTLHRKDIERTIEEELNRSSPNALKRGAEATINTLARTVEVRLPGVAHHQKRVSQFALSIARKMSLSEKRIREIERAARIHDLGEVYVPIEIINKPARLTETELSMVKTHPQSGYDTLKQTDLPFHLAKIVLQHHERLDGSGYPQGLLGKDILLEARIVGVADVVEAISSNRPYRPTQSIRKALEEISKNRGTLYDSDVVGACGRLSSREGI